MGDTLILVNSITHASRGKKALERQGIPTQIIRNQYQEKTSGCGYALAMQADLLVVQNILAQAGIKVVGIIEGA